jgi:hypothetical protein
MAGFDMPIELQIWTVILAYYLLRYGTRTLLTRLMVHRGMSHSIPTCFVWGAIVYLTYPSQYHPIRVWMAGAVMAGFLSHLVLDEVFSVDLKGQRVKRSFGTAIKLWAPSMVSTLGVYLLLYVLTRAVLNEWPQGSVVASLREPVPAPAIPELPRQWTIPRQWVDLINPLAGPHRQAIPASIGGPASN